MTSLEAKMFTNVLIGVDGRQGGRDAIALARQLAVTTGQSTAWFTAAFPATSSGTRHARC